MKALSYINASRELRTQEDKEKSHVRDPYGSGTKTIREITQKYHRLRINLNDWYSQKLSASAIPELFKGFSSKHGIMANNDGRINLKTDECVSLWQGTASLYYPQTLNDFIRDCERAEIDLEWNTDNEQVRTAFGL